MPNLVNWQSFLKQKMQTLDELWKLLDEVWKEAPSELTGEITDKADAFYQAYWDLFHAAVEHQNLEEVQGEVQDALNDAGHEVSSAWKIVVDFRTQKSEDELKNASNSGVSPLSEPRKALRDARAAISEGEEESGMNNYVSSVGKYKSCIEMCYLCDDKIGDAWETHRREKKRARADWVKIVIYAAVAAVLSFLAGKFL